jgi:hypothetical protein
MKLVNKPPFGTPVPALLHVPVVVAESLPRPKTGRRADLVASRETPASGREHQQDQLGQFRDSGIAPPNPLPALLPKCVLSF